MKSILTFIIVFGVIVVVHEFGHYFFAKKSGILVREFAIGMGPKLFSHRKNGTTYTLRLLPVGGYVRMAGAGEESVELNPGTPISIELNEQNEIVKLNTSKKVQLTNSVPIEVLSADLEDGLVLSGYVNGNENEEMTYQVNHDATIIEEDGTEVQIAPRDVQFQSAKLYQRMLTNFAGPLNNFILTIVLFILLAFLQGGLPKENTNLLNGVVEGGLADKAGMKADDRILSVNDQKITEYSEFVSMIQKNPGKELTVTLERDGQEKVVHVTPEATKEEDGKTVGKIGVPGASVEIVPASFFAKIGYGFSAMVANSLTIFKALGNLITGFSLDKLGGPVMIFKVSSAVAAQGAIAVISFMAMLSVNLGIMNLLPIPGLDGGKLVLNIYEGVRGKPLSQEKEGLVTIVGVVVLLVLMVLVTWNDIQRFFL